MIVFKPTLQLLLRGEDKLAKKKIFGAIRIQVQCQLFNFLSQNTSYQYLYSQWHSKGGEKGLGELMRLNFRGNTNFPDIREYALYCSSEAPQV